MENYIESLENYSEAMKYGFYAWVSEFESTGEILGYKVQDSDLVYVHKDYIYKFRELLKPVRPTKTQI